MSTVSKEIEKAIEAGKRRLHLTEELSFHLPAEFLAMPALRITTMAPGWWMVKTEDFSHAAFTALQEAGWEEEPWRIEPGCSKTDFRKDRQRLTIHVQCPSCAERASQCTTL
jgi:hypothetical protein